MSGISRILYTFRPPSRARRTNHEITAQMVNALVSRFADVRRENPARPLVHVPGEGVTLTASDVWDGYRRHADTLAALNLDRDQMIISALGNHSDSVSLLLALSLIH